MVDFQKLGEWLNKCVNESLIIRVGRYTGDYHLGNGKFQKITGEFFIKTNSDTIFRVVSDDSSIIDDFDVIGSDATITPTNKEKENGSLAFELVDVNNKEDLRAYFNNDKIGIEMFECVQSVPPRFRADALDIFTDKEDREMWTLKTVNKAWTYFIEEILEEMTDEEKKIYNF